MRYKVNNQEIELLSELQNTMSVSVKINELIKALGTPVEENVKEPVKKLTIEERKEELESGWEEQENYKYTTDISTGRYLTKQRIMAKLNTVIDKLNKEQCWVADWSDFQQYKYYFSYDVEDKEINIYFTGYGKELYILNYMSKLTADFLLENYKEELETLFVPVPLTASNLQYMLGNLKALQK